MSYWKWIYIITHERISNVFIETLPHVGKRKKSILSDICYGIAVRTAPLYRKIMLEKNKKNLW